MTNGTDKDAAIGSAASEKETITGVSDQQEQRVSKEKVDVVVPQQIEQPSDVTDADAEDSGILELGEEMAVPHSLQNEAEDVASPDEDAPFELSPNDVVEEGVVPLDDTREPVEHAFDFGTPGMVFDEDVPDESSAGTDGSGNDYDIQIDDAQESGGDSLFNGSGDMDVAGPSQVSFVDRGIPPSPPLPDGAVVNTSPQDVVAGDGMDTEEADDALFVSDDTVGDDVAPEIDEASDGIRDREVEADEEVDEDENQEAEELELSEVEEVAQPTMPIPPPVTPNQGTPSLPAQPGGLSSRGRPLASFFQNDKLASMQASLKLRAKTERKKGKREWWEDIFDDDYLMLLPERTRLEQEKQVHFIQRSLGLPSGALLLDLACGHGENAIGMAKKNFRMVGVDLSLSMLAKAGEAAQDAGVKINFIHGDMRDLGFDKTFDGVYCLDTSLGFFDDESNMKVLQGIHRSLKPGGTFLLDVANRDFVTRQQPNLVWFQMDNMVCMEESDFNYINNRLYINRQLIVGNNERHSRHDFSLRLYSLQEIGQMLHHAGFAVVKVSGHRATPGAFFGPESAKIILVARSR